MLPEPQAEEGECPVPDDLAPEARRIWLELAPELERKGLLAPRYALSFRTYCAVSAELLRCEVLLAKSGPVIAGKGGRVVSNPVSREYRHYAILHRLLGMEFGMTPAAVTTMGRQAGRGAGDVGDPERLLS